METGGCLCRKVRYKFDREKIVSAGHCHCKDCQKVTGSGKATIGARMSDLTHEINTQLVEFFAQLQVDFD